MIGNRQTWLVRLWLNPFVPHWVVVIASRYLDWSG